MCPSTMWVPASALCGLLLVGVELVASKQTSGSDSTAPDGPERGAAAAPAAASGPDAPLGRAGAASPGKRKKKKWKIQQKILGAVVVPLTAALIGSIGGIIGAEIQKSSSQAPSGSPTTPPPTPAPLGTGQYTVNYPHLVTWTYRTQMQAGWRGPRAKGYLLKPADPVPTCALMN